MRFYVKGVKKKLMSIGGNSMRNIIETLFKINSRRCGKDTTMVDITMCTQTLCPNAGHCYRIQAKASDWQSMATFNYTVSAHGVECDNYIPTYHAVTMTTTNNKREDFIYHDPQ